MEKKDIDLYLNKVNSAPTNEEKVAATRELVELIGGSIASFNQDRRMSSFVKLDQDLIDYLVESSAISVAHEVGIKEIKDLSRLLGFIVERSNASNKEEVTQKINDEVEKALKDSSILGEEPTQEQIDILDGIATRYLYNCIDKGTPVDDFARDAITDMFSKLPEGVSHRSTITYKLQILRAMSDRNDIGSLIPKKSIEEYRKVLSNPRYNSFGKVAVLGEFDDTLNEYMFHYGKTGEVSIEEKNDLFETLLDNMRAGRLIDSNAYTKYFSVSDYDDDQKVTYGHNVSIMRDILARIYENNGKDTRISEFEKILIDWFYLPREYNWEQEKPEEFAALKEDHPDMDPIINIRGELEDQMMNLFVYSESHAEEVAKYMIRLQNLFATRNRPKEEFLGKIYDSVKSINMVEALKNNLTHDRLKDLRHIETDEYEEMLKIIGIEFSEEDRELRRKQDEEFKASGMDLNVSRSGLRRIDYADIAIELMLEADFAEGVKILTDPETKKRFSEYGRNIYDSRAIRKAVELYVGNPTKYDKVYSLESMMEKYAATVVSKPDFNIFEEQGVAELLQLGNLPNKCYFASSMVSRIKQIMANNPTYSMSIDDSIKSAYDFIDKVGDQTIDQTMETEFDEFLINLTKIRMNTKNFTMPEDVVDFLTSQSMRPDSLINQNREKYGKVPERALEDLGKIDNLKRNGGQPLNYLYIVRDYMGHDLTMGLHQGTIINIKRERMDQLALGNPSVINTVFHENTHMNQGVRLQGSPSSYREYIMLKEDIIRDYDKYDEYYDTNYTMIIKEIEAREVAAQMTADYLGRIAPKSQEVTIADAVKSEVIDMISDKFKQEQARFSEESKREQELYVEALQKKDKDGQAKSVNKIFSNRFKNTSVMRNFMDKSPFAILEYDDKGNQRSFSEQMKVFSEVADVNFSPKQYVFIKNILTFGQDDKTSNSKDSMLALGKIMDKCKGSKLKEEFVGALVSANYLPAVSAFVKDSLEEMKKSPEVTFDRIDTYEAISKLRDTLKSNPDAAWQKAFNDKNDKGNSIMDMLDVYEKGIKLVHPNMDAMVLKLAQIRREQEIEAQRKKLEEQQRMQQFKRSNRSNGILGIFGTRRPGYKAMAGITVGVEGKLAVQQYETELEARDSNLQGIEQEQ